jgi:hypothetical protein
MNMLQKEKDEEKAQKALVAKMSFDMYTALSNSPTEDPDKVMVGVLKNYEGDPALTPEGVQAASTIAIQQTAKNKNKTAQIWATEEYNAAAKARADEEKTRDALNATTPGSTFKAQTALEKLAADKAKEVREEEKLALDKKTTDSTVTYQGKLGNAAESNAATAAKRAEDMMALAELKAQGKTGKEPSVLDKDAAERLRRTGIAALSAYGNVVTDPTTGNTTAVLPTDGEGNITDKGLLDKLNKIGLDVFSTGKIVGNKNKGFTVEFKVGDINPEYMARYKANEVTQPEAPTELSRYNKVFIDGFRKDDGTLNPDDPRLKELSAIADKSNDARVKTLAKKVFSSEPMTDQEVNAVRDLVKKVSLSNELDTAKPKVVPGAPEADTPAQSSTSPLQGVLGALRQAAVAPQNQDPAAPRVTAVDAAKTALGALRNAAAPQAPVPQAPVPQAPAPQAPAPQAPAPQVPVPQAPVPQAPVPQQAAAPRDYMSALSLLEKGLPGAIVKSNKFKQAPNNTPTANQGVPPEVIALIKVGQEVAASNPAVAEQIKTLLARVTSGEPLSEQEQKLMQLVLQRANKG